jgi:DNA primase
MQSLGASKFRETTEGLSTNCPIKEKHQNDDKHPSLFIYSNEGKEAYCFCHACGYKGSISALVKRVSENGEVIPSTQAIITEAQKKKPQFLEALDRLPTYWDIPPHIKFDKKVQHLFARHNVIDSIEIILADHDKKIKIKEGGIWTKLSKNNLEWLVLPFLSNIPQYWYDRGYSAQDAQKWRIGTHKRVYQFKRRKSKSFFLDYGERLLIPIFDYKKNLVGYSTRAIIQKTKMKAFKHQSGLPIYYIPSDPKYLHAPGFKRNEYLYGENLIDFAYRTCFLMEGFFDVINMTRHGFKNCLGIFGTALSKEQINKIKIWFDTVVFIPDGDTPGINAMQLAKKELQSHVKFITIDPNGLYLGRDPGDLSFEEASDILGDIF